ncbi:MAG: hypothetical protein JW910_23165, partial [Anaerolineae bacterium]|nr:hypothetical protein [Anaerolineae bacterium]
YASLHAKQSPTDKTRIAYYDVTNGKIKYAVSASGGNCTSSAYDCYAVDTVGIPPAFDLSMTVDAQGYPIIAYMNASTDLGPTTLDIARPAAAYGLSVGNCGDVPPGMLFMAWQCSTVDRGSAYTDEAEYVAVSVGPNGLAAIAYSEYNTYDEERYLKVAQQYHMVYLPLVLRSG